MELAVWPRPLFMAHSRFPTFFPQKIRALNHSRCPTHPPSEGNFERTRDLSRNYLSNHSAIIGTFLFFSSFYFFIYLFIYFLNLLANKPRKEIPSPIKLEVLNKVLELFQVISTNEF